MRHFIQLNIQNSTIIKILRLRPYGDGVYPGLVPGLRMTLEVTESFLPTVVMTGRQNSIFASLPTSYRLLPTSPLHMRTAVFDSEKSRFIRLNEKNHFQKMKKN